MIIYMRNPEYRTNNQECVRVCMEALRDRDYWMRANAAALLGEIGAEAAPAIGALQAALGDPAMRVRRAAHHALQRIQHEAYWQDRQVVPR